VGLGKDFTLPHNLTSDLLYSQVKQMTKLRKENVLKASKVSLLIFLAALLTGCGGFTKGKPAAGKAIAQFHQLFNEGKLEDIWNSADPQFRAAATKPKYDEFMGAVERKLGKVTSTSNTGWRVQSFKFEDDRIHDSADRL
jgi:hypothetical protein